MKKIAWILGFVTIILVTASISYADQCIICHPDGQPPPLLDCLASGCHDTYDNGNHHTTESALDGMCAVCHPPSVVANYDEDNPSTSPPTSVTPTVESCRNCHKGNENPLDQNTDPYPHPIYDTGTLEHMDLQGHQSWCTLCHDVYPPEDPPIRQCETCHTVYTLHNIAGHAVEAPNPLPYDGYWYDENGDWNLIAQNDRCIACHGSPPDPAPDTMLYVSQDVGTYDTTYSELEEADCRSCHGLNLANRHHQLIPIIDKIGNRKCYPGEKIKIKGSGFGETQGDSVVHINNKTYDAESPRIKLWTDTLIKVRIPFEDKDCSWFIHGDGEYRKRKVWVTVGIIDSEKKTIKVLKPSDCGQ